MRVLLLCAAIALGACGKQEPRQKVDSTKLLGEAPTDPDPQQGGTFVWGRGADAVKLDPANVTDGESVQVTTNIFDNLVTFERGGTRIRPWLAESWETDAERLVWTFKLRENVKFHDGTPCNADAVVFTFRRQQDPGHPARRAGDRFPYWHDNFKAVATIEATDEFTVRFTLEQRYEPFLPALAMHCCGIVSPTAFASEGKDEDGRYRYDFARKPVGTGPFVFQLWEKDARIVLEANRDYWADEKPNVDKLIFKPIENAHARLKELQSGSLSGMDNPALEDLGLIEKDQSLRLLSKPGINVCYLAMNTLRKPLDDIRVRQAVAFTIDKKRLIAASYDGVAQPAPTMCPRGMPGFYDTVDRRPTPDKALALLGEAGYADGFEVTLFHMANQRAYISNPSGTAIQIQQDLKQIGVKVTIKKLDWAAYLQAVQNGEHDMCLLGWMADIFDPDNFLYVLLDKENAVKGQAQNVSFYQSERVHKLLLQAQQESRWKLRERLYHDVQRIVYEECPVIPLATVPDFRVVRQDVRGYTIYPAGGEYFRHVSFARK